MGSIARQKLTLLSGSGYFWGALLLELYSMRITYSSVEDNPDRSSWLVLPEATYRNEYSDCARCATCSNFSFLLSRSS